MEAGGQLHSLSALPQGKSPRGWLGSTADLVAYEKNSYFAAAENS
jgi:hypothetical protein